MADNHVMLLGYLNEKQKKALDAPTHFFLLQGVQESIDEWREMLDAISKKGYSSPMSMLSLLLKYSFNYMEHQADHSQLGETCLVHIFAFTPENRLALQEFAFS